MSNILLFAPFGILCVGAGPAKLTAPAWMGALFAGSLGLFFGVILELGQVLFSGRTSSLMDALCNALGAIFGGFFGCLVFESYFERVKAHSRELIRARPQVFLLALLIGAVAADAFYPYHVTLDVSTIWGSKKKIQWTLFGKSPNGFWVDLIIGKVFVFAVIGYLTHESFFTPQKSLPSALKACLVIVACAALVEAGKIFFVGRFPNPQMFALHSMGAFLGVTLGPRLVMLSPADKKPYEVLIGLAVFVIAYSQLAPFDWVNSVRDLGTRTGTIEWVPFSAYYGANLQSALYDLGKKLFIIAPLGFLLAAREARKARDVRAGKIMGLGIVLGSALEALQLLQNSRVPAVTDILIFGFASWMGAALFYYYRGFIGGDEGQNSLGATL